MRWTFLLWPLILAACVVSESEAEPPVEQDAARAAVDGCLVAQGLPVSTAEGNTPTMTQAQLDVFYSCLDERGFSIPAELR